MSTPASHTPRVNTVDDRKTVDRRTARATTVGTVAILSPIYQAQPTLAQAGTDLVKAGVELAAAQTALNELDALVAKARSHRDIKLFGFDGAYSVYVSNAELFSLKDADRTAVALLLFVKTVGTLIVPSDILVKYNLAKSLIEINVKWPAKARHKCIIEISAEPLAPGSYKRLDGNGVTRKLTGYAPGTYWVRAATGQAKLHSDFFGPVSVIVK